MALLTDAGKLENEYQLMQVYKDCREVLRRDDLVLAQVNVAEG